MLKQHNVENAEIPRPFEDAAPEPLVQQHKAVVEAETAARLARAASNLKKERDKVILLNTMFSNNVLDFPLLLMLCTTYDCFLFLNLVQF